VARFFKIRKKEGKNQMKEWILQFFHTKKQCNSTSNHQLLQVCCSIDDEIKIEHPTTVLEGPLKK